MQQSTLFDHDRELLFSTKCCRRCETHKLKKGPFAFHGENPISSISNKGSSSTSSVGTISRLIPAH